MAVAELDRSQDLRDRILDATLQVMRERGPAQTRTSAIASAAGCAEGSIYRYFSGKPELLREVVRTRLPDLADLLPPSLQARAGSATVAGNLLTVARIAISFYRDVAFLVVGIASEPGLLERADLGSRRAADAVAGYLRAEQDLGRVRPDADPELTARLLLSSCLGQSLRYRLESAYPADDERPLGALVELLAADLERR